MFVLLFVCLLVVILFFKKFTYFLKKVSRRVAELYGDSFCGFDMAGAAKNVEAPVMFVTDGLLRARLAQGRADIGFDVIMLDELHERGVQVDLCLALLARRLVNAGDKADFKLLLSSATLDPNVLKLFQAGGPAASVGVSTFAVKVKAPFTIHVEDKTGHHYLNVVAEVSVELRRSMHVDGEY